MSRKPTAAPKRRGRRHGPHRPVVARHLQRSGFRIAVTDSRAAPPELEGVAALGPAVVTRTGGFDAQLLERADIVVTSPGVPLDDPFFVQARAAASTSSATSSCSRAPRMRRWSASPAPTARAPSPPCWAAWRSAPACACASAAILGQPALDLLDRGPTDLYVLELSRSSSTPRTRSSSRRAWCSTCRPTTWIVTPTLKAYAASKARIYANSETAVVNADEPDGEQHAARRAARAVVQPARREGGLRVVTPPAREGRGWRAAAMRCCHWPR
jgi:UDP-N-acetylmuramoylalanine--D-glutamate ligase